ncbi:hypothetical protein VHUM_01080 [Vanrija humicola]|uniref:Uncharacterized protein n=1 Tax=Vanrija humicola TaxID=5417 RepID=A0A7D8Z723_VANHU|nr:hypothetical protein VHUM_01080 [Vanrija humicola]
MRGCSRAPGSTQRSCCGTCARPCATRCRRSRAPRRASTRSTSRPTRSRSSPAALTATCAATTCGWARSWRTWWEVSCAQPCELSSPAAPVSGLAPSPSTPRETMLVASLDGKLRLFDRSNGSVLQTFSGHNCSTQRSKPAFARGEGSVLAGDEDGRLWSWSVLDGAGVSRAAHSRGVTTVLAHANGKEVITASLDGTIKVWGV